MARVKSRCSPSHPDAPATSLTTSLLASFFFLSHFSFEDSSSLDIWLLEVTPALTNALASDFSASHLSPLCLILEILWDRVKLLGNNMVL